MSLERWLLMIRLRTRSLLRRSRVEDELAEEIRFHLEARARELEARGLSPREARNTALRAFGGAEQRKEECRDARGVWVMDVFRFDLRYALRTLRRDAAFALTTTATLALCIAALTTVLTIVDAYYLKRLPVEHPDELVAVAATRRQPTQLGPVSFPDYVEFRDRTQTLQALAAHYPTAPLYVRIGDAGRELNGAVVTANFFPLLGIEPAIGRFFTPEEDVVPDRDRVAVIGHDFWRSSLGGHADAIGTSLSINGVAFTVIGIAPATFRGVIARPVDVYLPMMSLGVGYRWCTNAFAADCTILQMIGRLAPGRRLEDVAAEMTTLVPSAWKNHAEGDNKNVTAFAPRTVHHSPAERQFVALISGVAILLIVVGCANIAGLLAARATVRAPELALRASLGASRGRLLNQLLIETIVLAAAAGALGTVISRAMIQLIAVSFYSIDAEGHAMDFGFRLPWTVIAGALAASLAAGILAGLWPALSAARSASATRQTGRVTRSRVLGLGLAATQAATAVALVCVALLLSASATRVVDGANFDSERVALMRLRPRLVQYSPVQAQAFHREVLASLQQLPGVQSVSLIGQGAPLFGGGARVARPGPDRTELDVNFGDIAPRYFETLRIPLLAGRDFGASDAAGRAAVAIVSESLARRLFGTASVLDETVLVEGRPHLVIGVVADVRVQTRNEPVTPFVYVPFWQRPDEIDARYCVRVSGDPGAALPTLIRAVNAVDPDVPIAETIPLTIQMAGEFRSVRLTAAFAGYAALLTVVFTMVGLYGALAFAVSRRRKEIGVRVAIGATRRQVVLDVAGDAIRIMAVAVAVGLALAVAGVRLVQHLLVDLAVADRFFYAASAAVVVAVGLLASWLPARAAARVDPVIALRSE